MIPVNVVPRISAGCLLISGLYKILKRFGHQLSVHTVCSILLDGVQRYYRDHKLCGHVITGVRSVQVLFAGLMQYDGELKLPRHYLVPPPLIKRTTGEYLVHNDVATFACSEVRPCDLEGHHGIAHTVQAPRCTGIGFRAAMGAMQHNLYQGRGDISDWCAVNDSGFASPVGSVQQEPIVLFVYPGEISLLGTSVLIP